MAKKAKTAPAKEKPEVVVEKAEKEQKTEVATQEATEHPIRTLRGEIDRLFESFERGTDWWPARRGLFDVEPFFEPFRRMEPIVFGKRPSADVVETDDEFRVSAELPGMTEDEVEVTLSEGVLTIKGEKEESKEEKDEEHHVSERRYGMFRRSFSLPQSVDPDKVQAKMKDGVLSVVLPKLPEAKKETKKISVAKD